MAMQVKIAPADLDGKPHGDPATIRQILENQNTLLLLVGELAALHVRDDPSAKDEEAADPTPAVAPPSLGTAEHHVRRLVEVNKKLQRALNRSCDDQRVSSPMQACRAKMLMIVLAVSRRPQCQ